MKELILNEHGREIDEQGRIVAMNKHYRMKRIDKQTFQVLYDGKEIDRIVTANLKIENKKSVQNILKAKTKGLAIWVSKNYEKHNIAYTRKEHVFDKVCVIHYNELINEQKGIIDEKTV